jgi:hypothetical protein
VNDRHKRESDFDVGRRLTEATGQLASGNTFHVTHERLEIRDPSGALLATIPTIDIATTSRENSTVTLTRNSGATIALPVATREDARRLNGILGAAPGVRGNYIDNPFASNSSTRNIAIMVVVAIVVVATLLVICAALTLVLVARSG